MNAVIRKRNEVQVTTLEALDGKIEAVNTRVTELRADVCDLRADNKSLRSRIDQVYETLITALGALRDKMEDRFRAQDAKFDAVHEKLAKMSNDIAGLRGMQKAILWVMGVLGTLGMILITAAGKALHWF